MFEVDDARMTVIQLLPGLEAGGVERGVVEVVGALVEGGHRAIVVSNGGRLVKRIESLGGEHVAMPIYKKSLMTLRCIRPLRKLIRDTRADVLHARSRVPAWVGYRAWLGMPASNRPAWVTTVHGMYSVNRYSKIMTTGQRVEVVSNTIRKYVLSNYPGTDADKLVLNHRGVDPADFIFGYQPSDDWLAKWLEEYPELAGKFVISLAGRITRLKGHHDLIDAIEQLQQQGVNAHALIVGDEDPRRLAYAKELRDAVAEKGLADHVTFTGHRSDIKEVLAVSDAVVSLSTKPESFGRSVLEAVRLGRPVVGYDHGGVGEVLSEIYPHGLTPLSDGQALAQRLAAIASGQIPPPQPIDGKFLLGDMLKRTIAMYQDAVALNRQPTASR
ncbi:MAG: glycosyltransferase [Phycisphaeraceae bacterium]